MTKLVTRQATAIERKVVGASTTGLIAVLVIAALRYLRPEEADMIAPHVEPKIVWIAATVGGYMTRSSVPIHVEAKAQPTLLPSSG